MNLSQTRPIYLITFTMLPPLTYCMFRTTFFTIVLSASIACSSDAPSNQQGATDPLTVLNQRIHNNPTDLGLLAARGSWYYEHGDYRNAVADLQQAIRENPGRTSPIEWYHLLADAYLDGNQSLLALETLQKATAHYPRSLATWLKLSEFQLITRQHKEGLASIGKVHSITPAHAEGSFMKGLLYKDLGDTIRAKVAFHDATAEDPTLLDAWIELGRIYSTEDPMEALRYYDAALAQDSSSMIALHAKAVALADVNLIPEAIATYRAAVRLDPYFSDGYFNLGLLYLDQDSLGKALDHFELTTKTSPQYANAYFYKGVVHELTGNLTSARLDYETALNLDPNHERAKQGLKRVNPPAH